MNPGMPDVETVSHANVSVRRAKAEESAIVANMVGELLTELGGDDWRVDPDELLRTTVALLNSGPGVWAFLAIGEDDEPVGVLTVCECAAIYAGGVFGEITELYVVPASRSQRIGPRLIEAAATFGRARGWTRLEVGAPDVPRWQRTVDFYVRTGFAEIGPRLKLVID